MGLGELQRFYPVTLVQGSTGVIKEDCLILPILPEVIQHPPRHSSRTRIFCGTDTVAGSPKVNFTDSFSSSQVAATARKQRGRLAALVSSCFER